MSVQILPSRQGPAAIKIETKPGLFIPSPIQVKVDNAVNLPVGCPVEMDPVGRTEGIPDSVVGVYIMDTFQVFNCVGVEVLDPAVLGIGTFGVYHGGD